MHAAFPQCTYYSIRPLYPRDLRKNDDFHAPLVYTAPPYNYKRRRWVSAERERLVSEVCVATLSGSSASLFQEDVPRLLSTHLNQLHF